MLLTGPHDGPGYISVQSQTQFVAPDAEAGHHDAHGCDREPTGQANESMTSLVRDPSVDLRPTKLLPGGPVTTSSLGQRAQAEAGAGGTPTLCRWASRRRQHRFRALLGRVVRQAVRPLATVKRGHHGHKRRPADQRRKRAMARRYAWPSVVVGTGVDPVTFRFSEGPRPSRPCGWVLRCSRNPCSGAPSGTLQQKATGTVRGMLAGSSRDRGKTPAPACGHAAWWTRAPFAVSLLAGASLTARSAASSRTQLAGRVLPIIPQGARSGHGVQ